MSSFHSRGARLLLAAGLAAMCGGAWAQAAHYAGIGRAATPAEVAAWDIDVRPDFKGLPAGSGSVAQGQVIWEGKCASCHGVFGEANETFTPLVGGTTAEDIKTGRVARLTDPAFPGRTTLMKLFTVSTLWDYINRAMPWNAPKSLKTDEVYAVTAYLLNLGGVLPDDFVMSQANIAQVQQRLPNRNGVGLPHALWPGKALGNAAKVDAAGLACMKNCATSAQVASHLPEFARNNHGNLAEQQRVVGPQRGADTTRPPHATLAAARSAAAATAAVQAPAASPAGTAALALAQRHGCMACHGVDSRIVGPAFTQIAARYAGRDDAQRYLAGKISAGGQGLWGPIPMPAQPLPAADAQALADWLAAGARR